MNYPIDNEALLAEVLAEAAPADFREALLADTLRRARRRRRFRPARRAAVAFAVLGLFAALVWLEAARSPMLRRRSPPSCVIVHTRPLPAGAVVGTRPFFSASVVASADVRVVRTTAGSGGFRIIDDAQLLALVAPRPAVLVGTGPHSEELVFVDPADRKGFPVN